MCRLRNIAMGDYQESVTTGQTHIQTDRQMERQTQDKVIPMCRYASHVTQKCLMPLSDYFIMKCCLKYI